MNEIPIGSKQGQDAWNLGINVMRHGAPDKFIRKVKRHLVGMTEDVEPLMFCDSSIAKSLTKDGMNFSILEFQRSAEALFDGVTVLDNDGAGCRIAPESTESGQTVVNLEGSEEYSSVPSTTASVPLQTAMVPPTDLAVSRVSPVTGSQIPKTLAKRLLSEEGYSPSQKRRKRRVGSFSPSRRASERLD